MATRTLAPRTIRVNSEFIFLLASVTTNPTSLFTLRSTIALPSIAATVTSPQTPTLAALAVLISGQVTLPAASAALFLIRIFSPQRAVPGKRLWAHIRLPAQQTLVAFISHA